MPILKNKPAVETTPANKGTTKNNNVPSYQKIAEALYSVPRENEVKTPDDHKAEILATRKGGFGSSDAAMIVDIAYTGKVLPKYYERLGVFAGILEVKDFSNKYTETGNIREREVFEYLQKQAPDNRFISNPTFYDTDNVLSEFFNCFTHIDIVKYYGQENEFAHCYEVKTSQDSTETLIERYDAQLKWHSVLTGCSSIMLIHYRENWNGADFNADNIVIKSIDYSADEIRSFIQKIQIGLDVIRVFLSGQEATDDKDILEHCKEKTYLKTAKNELSESLDKQMANVKDGLETIKKLQESVDAVKEKIFKTMSENNIDVWETDYFRLNIVKGSTAISFDAKKFEKEQPDLYKEYYTKETHKKPYLTIKIKE